MLVWIMLQPNELLYGAMVPAINFKNPNERASLAARRRGGSNLLAFSLAPLLLYQ